MKTHSPAERFRRLVEAPEVPELPTTQQGKFDLVSNSILTAVSYLAEVVRTADGPTALKAACELIALEKARMRHRADSVIGAREPPVEDPEIPPLGPLFSSWRATVPAPVLDDDDEWEDEDEEREWVYAKAEAPSPPLVAPASEPVSENTPARRPVPQEEEKQEKKPFPPRIDPFAPRPPDAPRALVDGPPTISFHALKLLEWKREDPESYDRLVLARGDEPEAVREYEAYFRAKPPGCEPASCGHP